MRCFFCCILLAAQLLCAHAKDLPTNHLDLTAAIIDFLSRTELCLTTCRDTASTKAAVPQLSELKKECDQLIKIQRTLPEPTVQDYMAVQHRMGSFTTIWDAIKAHIERLEQEQLLTEEIREILKISPPSAPK